MNDQENNIDIIRTESFFDLWYTIRSFWKYDSNHVDFYIYKIISYEDVNKVEWNKKGSQTSPNPVSNLDEAEIFLHGYVKWDGCSNWYFDEQDNVMIHACDNDQLLNIGKIMAECYNIAKDIMPNFDD